MSTSSATAFLQREKELEQLEKAVRREEEETRDRMARQAKIGTSTKVRLVVCTGSLANGPRAVLVVPRQAGSLAQLLAKVKGKFSDSKQHKVKKPERAFAFRNGDEESPAVEVFETAWLVDDEVVVVTDKAGLPAAAEEGSSGSKKKKGDKKEKDKKKKDKKKKDKKKDTQEEQKDHDSDDDDQSGAAAAAAAAAGGGLATAVAVVTGLPAPPASLAVAALADHMVAAPAGPPAEETNGPEAVVGAESGGGGSDGGAGALTASDPRTQQQPTSFSSSSASVIDPSKSAELLEAFQRKRKDDRHLRAMLEQRAQLPAHEKRAQVLQALQHSQVVVVSGG
jgi:hypothetical protein